MVKEVFIVKNNTLEDIELKDFGVVISTGDSIELENFDRVLLSDDVKTLLIFGNLIRVIDGSVIDIIDTIGGTIFLAPDHVMSFGIDGIKEKIDKLKNPQLMIGGVFKY